MRFPWLSGDIATITQAEEDVQVTSAERAHNPLLPAAALDKADVAIPRLGNSRLTLAFG